MTLDQKKFALSDSSLCIGIEKDMPSVTGKKLNTAIPLNWKHNVCGTMLVITMFTD